MATQTFTSSDTWIAPAGVTQVDVSCWGAGGGGGGGSSASAGSSGGGGGGGSFAKKVGLAVVPGTGYAVTVGTGGGGGGDGSGGADGGDTWFDSSSTVLALGGRGGGNTGGGSGGSLGTGDTVFIGGRGGDGDGGPSPGTSGGGGGSAGDSGAGGDGSGSTNGAGGSGGGDGGHGYDFAGSVGSAFGGASPGGGGAGGAFNSPSGDIGSAGGGEGQVVLSWTAPPPPAAFLIPSLRITRPIEDDEPIYSVRLFGKPQNAAAYTLPVGTFAPHLRMIRPIEEDEPAYPRILVPRLWIAQRYYQIAARMIRPEEFDEDQTGHGHAIGRNIITFGPRVPIDVGRRYAAARGLYRIFAPVAYRFYRSSVAPPAESDTPFATSATLPSTPASTFADGVWYLSMSYFNGVLDSGFLPIGAHGESYLRLEIAGGVAIATRPSGPISAKLEARAGGVIRIVALYPRVADGSNAATEWAIHYTVDGSTPANNSPNITRPMSSTPLAALSYDLPAQANGTAVKVQVQTRRGSSYSLPRAVLTAIVSTTGPTAPLAIVAWPGALPEDL